MTTYESHPPGAIVWADVVCPDRDRGIAFYTAVFGWTVEELEPGGYVRFRSDGRVAAGLAPVGGSSDVQASWTVYFGSADADATMAAAVAAGARPLIAPRDVGDQGRMAYGLDPTGAAFGIWQAGGHRGFEVLDEPGAACWFEVVTRDRPAADTFYAGLFPYTVQRVEPSEGATEPVEPAEPGEHDYTVLLLDGRPVGGSRAMPEFLPDEVPAHWMTFLSVAEHDTDGAVVRLQDNGGILLHGPRTSPYGRYAVVADPWGAIFTLLDRPEATS